MIHFDFIVEDIDAENIFNVMRSAITANNMAIQKAIINGDQELIIGYKNQNTYIESLIKCMKNTQCY